MKDTRPVHMGTYEVNKKHVENQISMLKVDIKNLTLSVNRLNNILANQKKMLSTLNKGWVALLIINLLAILSKIFL